VCVFAVNRTHKRERLARKEFGDESTMAPLSSDDRMGRLVSKGNMIERKTKRQDVE